MNPPDPLSAPDAITPDDLRRLAVLVEKHGLSELRYEQGNARITLRTAAHFRERAAPTVTVAAPPAASGSPALPPVGEPEATASAAPPANAAPGVRIDAPIMGVFYRTASPNDPPLIEVGDTVEVGQSVGLIEAMKVFSEIKSEVAGVVREIVAANKTLVQPGDALVILDVA